MKEDTSLSPKKEGVYIYNDKAQQHGSRKAPKLWAKAKGINVETPEEVYDILESAKRRMHIIFI